MVRNLTLKNRCQIENRHLYLQIDHYIITYIITDYLVNKSVLLKITYMFDLYNVNATYV